VRLAFRRRTRRFVATSDRFVARRYEASQALPTVHLNASPMRLFRKEHTMTDNILSAVLTFGLLASGTAAIGSEMFNTHRAAPTQETTKVVMLPAVTVTGHRESTQVVMLPTVTVTGHRDTVMAYNSGTEQAQIR